MRTFVKIVGILTLFFILVTFAVLFDGLYAWISGNPVAVMEKGLPWLLAACWLSYHLWRLLQGWKG